MHRLTERVQAVVGRPIVFNYKAGARGPVGAQDVMNPPADGYTLMLAKPRHPSSCSGLATTSLNF